MNYLTEQFLLETTDLDLHLIKIRKTFQYSYLLSLRSLDHFHLFFLVPGNRQIAHMYVYSLWNCIYDNRLAPEAYDADRSNAVLTFMGLSLTSRPIGTSIFW